MRNAALLPTLLLTSCGADFGDGGDGGPACDVVLEVTSSGGSGGTSQWEVPFVARVQATLSTTSVPSYGWQVTGPDGGTVPFTVSSPVESSVEFSVGEPGNYRVQVGVTVSAGSCSEATNILAVPPGALTRTYRLRFTPFDPSDPPPQDDPLTLDLIGGTGVNLVGERRLSAGVEVDGTVHDGGGGPLSAYLRLIPALGLTPTEVLVGAAGTWRRWLSSGTYDVVVAPMDDALPALRLDDVTAVDLDDLTIDNGDRVSGTVRRSNGTGLAGARVAVRAGAVPAVLATTDAGGAWQARLHAGYGPLSVRVVPPAGQGLPELELASDSVVVSPDTVVNVTYAAASATALGPTIRPSGGGTLPGATVTFAADSLPAGGSMTVGGVSVAVVAKVRAVAVADGSGSVSLTLPNGSYDVVVEPPSSASTQAPAHYSLNLGAGSPPASFATAAARLLPVQVRDPDGAAVSGARVTIVSLGHGGLGAGRAAVGTTNASGAVTLGITPGAAHDVVVDPPLSSARPLARARASLTGAETSLDVAMPAGLVLRGTVLYPNGPGKSGIRVEAFCVGCTSTGAIVSGETLTRAGGEFDLPVPDPGVE